MSAGGNGSKTCAQKVKYQWCWRHAPDDGTRRPLYLWPWTWAIASVVMFVLLLITIAVAVALSNTERNKRGLAMTQGTGFATAGFSPEWSTHATP